MDSSIFSPLCKMILSTFSMVFTYYFFLSERRLHVKDVLMASSALAMGEVVKFEDRDVTVVRLYTGLAGSRDALYVVTDQPSAWETFWWTLQNMAMQITTKEVTQDPSCVERIPLEMNATEAATSLLQLSPGQCVVPRHELQAAHDDVLAASLRVLERNWNLFMFVKRKPFKYIDAPKFLAQQVGIGLKSSLNDPHLRRSFCVLKDSFRLCTSGAPAADLPTL